MKSTHIVKPKIVALLDVDRTLIGNVTFDHDPDGDYRVEKDKIKNKLLKGKDQNGNDFLNKDLLMALQKKVENIYLFTDMGLSRTEVIERQALIEILEDEKFGFHVYGVITPADPVWHLNPETGQESKDSQGPGLCNAFETARKIVAKEVNADPKEIMAEEVNADPKEIVAEEVNADPKKIEAKALNCRSITKESSLKEDMPSVKGKMFQHFLEFNKMLGYEQCIVADDLPEVITSVHQVNEQAKSSAVQLSTLCIAAYGRKKQIQESEQYYSTVLALNEASLKYERYLRDRIHDEKVQPGALEYRKLAAVKRIQSAVPDGKRENSESHLASSKRVFAKHHAEIIEGGDVCSVTFSRIAAGILTADTKTKDEKNEVAVARDEVIAIDWDAVIAEPFENKLYEGAIDFLKFLRTNNYQVIVFGSDEFTDIAKIQQHLKEHNLDDFINEKHIFIKNSSASGLFNKGKVWGPDWRLNILKSHREITGLKKQSYLMIDWVGYAKLIIDGGYPIFEAGRDKSKELPDKDFYKQAQVFINPIANLEIEIKQQVKRYRANAQACFSFGNNRKADRIEQALARVKQAGAKYASLDAFLDAKLDGQESLRQALSHHRIGFFGRTRSQITIETKVVESRNRVTFHS